MLTIVGSPSHIVPTEIQAPVLRDAMGQGDFELRRQWTRTLRKWDLQFDGNQERLDELSALLDYAQGDITMWFDGAGTLDLTQPVLLGIGNGQQIDFNLLHKNVFVASMVVYLNGAATNAWAPLGGDGIICDKIRMTSAPGNYAQLRAKYRRKAKVVFKTDQTVGIQRLFRNPDNPNLNIYRHIYSFQELPK